MLKIDFTSLKAPVIKAMTEMEKKHLPFVALLTATRLAQRVKKGELSVMRQRLDRPTPTTMNSIFVKMATKGKPAEVYFKDSWASGVPADTYLQQAVFGGARPHKGFEKALIGKGLMGQGQYALPSSAFLNQYGNVSRGTITKILSGLGAAERTRGYQSNASGSRRSKKKGNATRFFAGSVDGAQGIWERKGTAFGEGVRPVFLFSGGAPRYRTIFPFFRIAENIIRANYARDYEAAFMQATAGVKS